jgi:hypothetical protein
MRPWIGSAVAIGLALAALARAAEPAARTGTWCAAWKVPLPDPRSGEIESVRLPDGWKPVGGTTASFAGGNGVRMACATFP